jgi:uncharacterized protein (DUF433 family)
MLGLVTKSHRALETGMTGPRIVSDPDIMMGKPVIEGTRITVEHILRMFAAGHTEQTVLEAHPHLTVEGIRAAQAYAADNLAAWRVLAAE